MSFAYFIYILQYYRSCITLLQTSDLISLVKFILPYITSEEYNTDKTPAACKTNFDLRKINLTLQYKVLLII